MPRPPRTRSTSGSPNMRARATWRLRVTARDPIALVGLACRMPGVPDAAALWQRLRDGAEAIPDLTEGGRGLDEFDAELFDISPREAASIDPQQGLALERSWAGLETGGIA